MDFLAGEVVGQSVPAAKVPATVSVAGSCGG